MSLLTLIKGSILTLSAKYVLFMGQLLHTMKANQGISLLIIVLVYTGYKLNKILIPPKELRHIPHVSYLGAIYSLLNDKSYVTRAETVHLPFVYKNNLGIYLEPSVAGWSVVVANPEDAKKVFMNHNIFPKGGVVVTGEGGDNDNTLFAKFLGGPNMFFLDGQHWKLQRMIANPAFKTAAPVNMFGALAQDMFQAMDNTGGTTFDMSHFMERWTLEVLGKAVFDFSFNGILYSSENKWIDMYQALRDGVADLRYFFLPCLDYTFRWLFPHRVRLHKMMAEFEGLVDDMILKKRAEITLENRHDTFADNEKDLLTLMIENEVYGNGTASMSDHEIKSNVLLYFVAGHDTTSSSLQTAIYFLAVHQDIQKKARREIFKLLGDEPEDVIPTLEETKKMAYITQILNESMRIVTPAPRPLSRVAQKDSELSGMFIPKGTSIAIDLYDIHHSKRVWENPSEFNPDRFAEDGEASQHKGLSFSPFGNGARKCIAMNFSMAEQRVMLTMLLRKFTWSLPKDSIHENGLETIGFPVIQPTGLKIDFSKRY